MDLLTEIWMLECKLADTPIEMNHKLCEDMDQEPTNKEQYQRLVWKLIYLAHTRLDIAYAMSVEEYFMTHLPSWALVTYMHQLEEECWREFPN